MTYTFSGLIEDSERTESCISTLLDTSVRHSPHFDWVVAHIGGCFPDTVINRVLTVGLKDFCQHAETQVSRSGLGRKRSRETDCMTPSPNREINVVVFQRKKNKTFALSGVPKINSVVGILGYLASSHDKEIRTALGTLVDASLVKSSSSLSSKQDFTDTQIGTVPYLLYLASLSEMLAATLTDRGT